MAIYGRGGRQTPAVRLLFRPLKLFPEPRSLVPLALIAEARPELAKNVLLFTQALFAALGNVSRYIPYDPGPLIVAPLINVPLP